MHGQQNIKICGVCCLCTPGLTIKYADLQL